jgi:hypothetical protein
MISELDYCQESNPIRRILGMKCLALRMRNSERTEIVYYLLHSSQGGGLPDCPRSFPTHSTLAMYCGIWLRHSNPSHPSGRRMTMRDSKETNMENEQLANLLLGLVTKYKDHRLRAFYD